MMIKYPTKEFDLHKAQVRVAKITAKRWDQNKAITGGYVRHTLSYAGSFYK